jgi:chaperone required for assembly of F1-ATPase
VKEELDDEDEMSTTPPVSYFNDRLRNVIKEYRRKEKVEEEDPEEFERNLKRKLGLPDTYQPRATEEVDPLEAQREQIMLNLVERLMEEVPLPDNFPSGDIDLKTQDDERELVKKIKEACGVTYSHSHSNNDDVDDKNSEEGENLRDKEALAARMSFDQSQKTMKDSYLEKFYKSLSIHPHVITRGNKDSDIVNEKGYVVRIGAEQLLKSPNGRVILFPNRHLAAAVVSEWELQRGYLRPSTMPLTDLVGHWQDIKSEMEEGLTFGFARTAKRTVVGFFDSEFLCLRQDLSKNRSTLELIKQLWDPVVQWFQKEYGANLLIAGPDSDFSEDYTQNEAREAFVKRYTSDENLAEFRQLFIDWTTGVDMAHLLLDKISPQQLTILYAGTQITKSILISLSLMHGQTDYKTAMAASQLLVRQQVSNFGLVEGEHDVLFAEEASRLAALQLFKMLTDYGNK